MICTQCKRRLKSDAISCLCGWNASGSRPNDQRVACCYVGCPEPALARVPTATGWADVCRTHYPQVDIVRKRSNSPAVLEIRAAIAGRSARGIDGHIADVRLPLPREPGSDDEEIAA